MSDTQNPARPAPARPTASSESTPHRYEVVLAADGPVGAALAEAGRRFERSPEWAEIVAAIGDELGRLRDGTYKLIHPAPLDRGCGLHAARLRVLSGLLASDRVPDAPEPLRGPRLLVRTLCRSWLDGWPRWSSRSAGVREFRRAPTQYGEIFGGLIPEHETGAALAAADRYHRTDRVRDWPYVAGPALRADPIGFPTGFPTLDACTGGVTGLTLVAGPPAAGKTTFALSVLDHVLNKRPGVHGVIMTAEESKETVLRRVACRYAGVAESDLRRGGVEALTAAQQQRLATRLRRFLDRVTLVTDVAAGPGGGVPERLTTILKGLPEPHAGAVVLIDGLPTIPALGGRTGVAQPPRGGVGTNEDATDAETLAAVRGAIGAFNAAGPERAVAIVVTATTGPGGRPDLADVRGGSTVLGLADQVLLLDREGDTTPDWVTPVRVRAAKARGGTEGQVHVHHQFAIGTMTEPKATKRAKVAGRLQDR